MSAKFVDALKGYEYYLGKRGEATLEDVNHYLKTHGRTSVQLRTYGHYRKLLAHGFRSYIPINQFDVFQAIGKLQMAADRRRYQRDRVQISAKISYDCQYWQEATIIDKSLVGFGIIMPDMFAVSKGTRVWVRLEGYEDIPVILVWRNHNQEEHNTRLGVRAFEFIANYRFVEEEPDLSRLTGVLQISREQEGVLDWEHIYRIFDKTNQLLDSVGELVYSINETLHSEVFISRPVLLSVKFGSPGELQTKVDFGVAEIIRVLIEKFQFWSLDKTRYIEENRKRELENVNLSIEVARNAIHFHDEAVQAGMTDDAIAAILDPVKRVFKRKLPKHLFDEGTLERGMLAERVLPAVAELVAGDDPEFKIQVYQISKQKPRAQLQRKGNRTH